jgi:hypothetical protein
MAKYYIQSGSLQLIYSTNKDPINAAITALWETNENDVLDEFFYVDERGMKDYKTPIRRKPLPAKDLEQKIFFQDSPIDSPILVV